MQFFRACAVQRYVAQLTEICCHDLLVFWLLFSGTSFLSRWRCCGAIEERALRNIGFDPSELGRGIGRVVGPGWGPRVWPRAHLRRPRHGHVGSVLRHRFIVQPGREESKLLLLPDRAVLQTILKHQTQNCSSNNRCKFQQIHYQ